ncbi:hypothetical protein FRC08_012512 [Ceratobasidium sp. 394]|nr:hypothetical protein FRC08_012512 [Ceratobasidium sp. 394]
MAASLFSVSRISGKSERCPMEFGSVWGKGAIFDWYRDTLTSRIVNRLEIRITRDTVPHRFVVAYMEDGSICRFDRRPRNAQILLMGPQGPDDEQAGRAADEACIVNGAIDLSTHWEIRLDLPAGADILLILSACYAIAQDEKARNYTLREYNCYFFSWTIVMLVTRHLLPFTVPPSTAVESRFHARLDECTAAVSDIIV